MEINISLEDVKSEYLNVVEENLILKLQIKSLVQKLDEKNNKKETEKK